MKQPTEHQLGRLRRAADAGASLRAMSDEMGASRATVRRWLIEAGLRSAPPPVARRRPALTDNAPAIWVHQLPMYAGPTDYLK